MMFPEVEVMPWCYVSKWCIVTYSNMAQTLKLNTALMIWTSKATIWHRLIITNPHKCGKLTPIKVGQVTKHTDTTEAIAVKEPRKTAMQKLSPIGRMSNESYLIYYWGKSTNMNSTAKKWWKAINSYKKTICHKSIPKATINAMGCRSTFNAAK